MNCRVPLRRATWVLVLAVAGGALSFNAQTPPPIRYRFTFPEPEHHWMQVDASFGGLSSAPLELRMSLSSPGRYSIHEFSKNVYDVHVFAADGTELATTRPDPYGWTVPVHPASVEVKYKVFGDLLDGTYLAIDATHAHINLPAAVLWARKLEDRPSTITLAEPPGQRWVIATQLHPGATPFEFTAPNLQYLMDSPVEFGPLAVRQFSVGGRTFRLAMHHTGTDAELDAFVRDVEKIVREEGAMFGEYPAYEPGNYVFLVDYLPYADEDGMEHRNSTVITSSASLRNAHAELLDTVAHEFFHSWNVERIRPRSLEPFDLERVNIASELWFAEGFTEYYGPLTLSRAGLASLAATSGRLAGFVNSIAANPARELRSAEEMSRMAAFTDGGRPIDRTNFSNTVISYYQFGGAIALALDLALRSRTDGRVTLDDYMRAMWTAHGKPGGSREGYVDKPYTAIDAEARLAEVSGDAAFARDFFARYIQGHDLADYTTLLARAGLLLRKQNPGRAWWGQIRLELRGGSLRIATATPKDTPVYLAGLDLGDQIRQLDGSRVGSVEEVNAVINRRKPGDRIQVAYTDRAGTMKTSTVQLVEDPHLEIVPVESTGASLTPEQKALRERWLGPH